MTFKPHPVGANVTIKWKDSGEVVNRYFSFGQYNEELNEDEFGIPDDSIFFYAYEGEDQLNTEDFIDWTVEAYELIYHTGN